MNTKRKEFNSFKEMKSYILYNFCLMFPKEVELMMNCQHGSSIDNPNINHIEGSVWTHTILVLNSIEDTYNYNKNLVLIFASLTHDFGKCLTRAPHKKIENKITFYGHAEASTQFNIDVVYKFYDTHPELFLNSFGYIINYSTYIVSNHMLSYNIKDYNQLFCLCNKNMGVVELFHNFTKADEQGQFTINDNQTYKSKSWFNMFKTIYDEFDEYNYCVKDSKPHDKLYECIIICGLPGSGKDYLVDKTVGDFKKYSFDNIRTTRYKNDTNYQEYSNLSEKEIYSKSFEYCNYIQLDLLKELKIQLHLNKLTSNNKKIYICNTNLRSSSRKKLINCVKDVYNNDIYMSCIYILCSTEKLIKNDSTRLDHTVGTEVIKSMSKHYSIPTLLEGFDNVTYRYF